MDEEDKVPGPVEAAAPVTEDKTEADAGRKNLTEAQWAEIVERAELGTSKSSELAREFGISPQAVSNYFKKHGVTVGSRKGEIAKKVGAAVGSVAATAAATFEEQRRARIEETKTDHYNWTTIVTRQIMKKVVDAAKASDPIAKHQEDIRTYQMVLKSLEISRKERYALLDVEKIIDEAALPEIQIRDLTEEEIAAMRDQVEEDDGIITLDDDEIISEGEDGE